MDIPLLYITTGVKGGLRDGFRTTLYGLCEEGNLWCYDPKHDEWKRMSNPQSSFSKSEPDDTGDRHPSWREL